MDINPNSYQIAGLGLLPASSMEMGVRLLVMIY